MRACPFVVFCHHAILEPEMKYNYGAPIVKIIFSAKCSVKILFFAKN